MTSLAMSRASLGSRVTIRSALPPSAMLRHSTRARRRSGAPHLHRARAVVGFATTSRSSERTARVVSTSAAVLPLAPLGVSSAAEGTSNDSDSWQFKILYDGDCHICMREVDFLQRRNESYKTLKFVDIANPQYDPQENGGVSFEEAMGHIHGISRSGEIFTGVEAFQKFYEAVGLGWVIAATKLKPVQVLADAAYGVFSKYRLPLSGRPSLEALLEERHREKEGVKSCNEEEECVVEW